MKDNLPDRADGPLIMVIGDRSEPLMLALLDLEASRPGMLDNLIEVLPSDGSDLSITEIRLLRPPYKKVLDDISPVSYTHLDVYKRQDQYPAQQGLQRGQFHQAV